MRLRALAIPVGVILFLLGLVWFLQGIGTLPGSFMTGSQFWAAVGGFTVVIGLVLVGVGVTGRRPQAS